MVNRYRFPFFARSSAHTGPAGSATALLRPRRGRVQTSTALLRPRCGRVQTSTALLRHGRGRVQTSTALLRHCRGRVNTNPQLPSHLWDRPAIARPFMGQAHSCPAICGADPQLPSQLPGAIGKRSLSPPVATPHIRPESMAAES